MTRRAATLSTAGVLVVTLGVGAAQLDVPYVALGPGPVTNTLGAADGRRLIEVSGRRTYETSGHLDLTTVNVYPDLDLASALRYWFDRRTAVVPREVVYPPDQTPQETERQTRREMEESQDTAVTAALRHLRIPVERRIVVERVLPDSGAQAAGIAVGDVLVAADGRRVESIEDLQRVISARKPGAEVRISYRRDGARRAATVRTKPSSEDPDRAVIGVELSVDEEYPFRVEIRLDAVGGPSAGLMFALGVVDLLTPGKLTGGRHVAGTGTIDADGNVGPIGGIQQKLVGAREAGAGYFLVPAGNWDAAVRARPDGLRLYRVATLGEAVDTVRRIGAG